MWAKNKFFVQYPLAMRSASPSGMMTSVNDYTVIRSVNLKGKTSGNRLPIPRVEEYRVVKEMSTVDEYHSIEKKAIVVENNKAVS